MAQIFLHFGDREMSPISMSNKEIFNLTSHFFREIADLPLGHEVHVTAQLLLGSADGIKSQTISTFSVVLDRIRRLWQPLSGQNISWKRWLFQPKSSQTSAASREKKFRENDGTTVQIFTEISWNRSSVDRSSLSADLLPKTKVLWPRTFWRNFFPRVGDSFTWQPIYSLATTHSVEFTGIPSHAFLANISWNCFLSFT